MEVAKQKTGRKTIYLFIYLFIYYFFFAFLHILLLTFLAGLYYSVSALCKWTELSVETMSLCEMGPQLKLPINVTKGTMQLQCNSYFQKLLVI